VAASPVSAEDVGWAGGMVLQKLLGVTRLALKPASGGALGMVIGGWHCPSEGLDDPLVSPGSRASPLPPKVGS